MLKTMLKTSVFSHAKKMRDRKPCRLNIGKHLCSSNQPKFEERVTLKVQPPPEKKKKKKKDLFLYLDVGQQLWRLNIRELCGRWSQSKKPQLEVVHVFDPNAVNISQPCRLEYIYSFRPGVKLFTLGNKLCVLDSRARSFKEFDPLHESWRLLPYPPCYEEINDENEHLNEGFRSFMDDEKYKEFLIGAEFQGFLIGVDKRNSRYQIVANYEMESDRNRREPDQVLHEIQGPIPRNCQFFLGKCDGGLMWLVYSGLDITHSAYTCVTVFRVSVSYDIAGNPVISANVEASSEIIDADSEDKSVVSFASALCHHLKIMPQKRDWFLYLSIGKRLCRVNITEFCERSSPKPKFEVAHSFPEEGHPSPIPRRMTHITLGSKSYMVGGERVDRSLHCDANGRCFPMPNLDIYSFNPTLPNRPLITMCNGVIPMLIDPKAKTIPIVTTIEEKIYVLSKRPYSEELDDDQPPKFKVFDPLHQSWKHLPDPPCYNKSLHDTELFVYNHFAWGHKLIIRTKLGSYIFDTHQEKWEDTPHEFPNEGFKAVVEVRGFLIGMPHSGKELVAYQLDSNGIFKPYKVLHELQGIFRTSSLVFDYYLGKYDDERIWLVYSGMDGPDYWNTWVVVLRVFTSIDNVGNSVLSVDIEAAECLHSNWWWCLPISSAFSLCHLL